MAAVRPGARRLWLAAVLGLLVAFSAAFWWFLRPAPAAETRRLFDGVTYTREVRRGLNPQVAHIVVIDLRTKGLGYLVTPGDPQQELPLTARTTSQFLSEFDVQLAINGDGFTPWRANGPLDTYPRAGERVRPLGLAASRGVPYAEPQRSGATLYISKTGQMRFNEPTGKLYNAISGDRMLVEQGRPVPGIEDVPDIQPRSAVGLDKAGKKLILVVVDGRQPGYSLGASLYELADILRAYGAFTAMNLDGGGSSALVMAGPNGAPQVLNSPIDQNIPGRERLVGNHLGIVIP